jgi:hypothetical protein
MEDAELLVREAEGEMIARRVKMRVCGREGSMTHSSSELVSSTLDIRSVRPHDLRSGKGRLGAECLVSERRRKPSRARTCLADRAQRRSSQPSPVHQHCSCYGSSLLAWPDGGFELVPELEPHLPTFY